MVSIRELSFVVIIFSLAITSCAKPTHVPVLLEPENFKARIEAGDKVILVTRNNQQYEFEVEEITDLAIIGEQEKVLFKDIIKIDKVYATKEENFIIGGSLAVTELALMFLTIGHYVPTFSYASYRLQGKWYNEVPLSSGLEEFTEFEVTINFTQRHSSGATTISNCPSSANIILSMLKYRNEVIGSAELRGFNKRGETSTIFGLIEGNKFSFIPFSIEVSNYEPPIDGNPSSSVSIEPFSMPVSANLETKSDTPSSSISLSLMKFEGRFADIDENGVVNGIEGTMSGKVFENQDNITICDSMKFDGVFSGKATKSIKGYKNSINGIKIER